MKTTKILGLTLLSASLFFAACSKDDQTNDGKSAVKVKMTDAPGKFDAVLIDLQQIELKMEEEGWIALETNAGIYNLLEFSNGKDTVVANDTLPAGEVEELRLILGENNSVVVNGDTFDLKIPSGQSSGLKIKLDDDLDAGLNEVIKFDFDVAMSIKQNNKGEYKLRPVIRILKDKDDDDADEAGEIEGEIRPADVQAKVFAILNGDTIGGAISEDDGEFEIEGLASGIYEVAIDVESPYADTVITDVNVVLGEETELGEIQLRLK